MINRYNSVGGQKKTGNIDNKMRKRRGVPCSKQLFTCVDLPVCLRPSDQCVCVFLCRIALFCVICTFTPSVPHPPVWNPVSKDVKKCVEVMDEGKIVICGPCVCIYICVCLFSGMLFVWLSLRLSCFLISSLSSP